MCITENIAKKEEECNIQNVLNCIAPYSHMWKEIGEHLVGRDHYNELRGIADNIHISDHKAHLVELWHRVEPDVGFSWVKLSHAIKQVQTRRESATSMEESFSPSLLAHVQPSPLSKFF